MPKIVLYTLVYPVIHNGNYLASSGINSLLIKSKVFSIKKYLR